MESFTYKSHQDSITSVREKREENSNEDQSRKTKQILTMKVSIYYITKVNATTYKCHRNGVITHTKTHTHIH